MIRFYFQRSLGVIYAFAFLIALNQFKGLCGETGLLPMSRFIKRIKFWDAPSLFWLNQSNTFIRALAFTGFVLSIVATIGLSDALGLTVSVLTWFLLWVIYLSFVNVGQTFYGFGWEVLLLETGFLAIFMGPSNSQPSMILIYLLRWLLFRLMFGAGLIKMRGDKCWRDLTCMQYHYETMPSPGPTSWYFHHLPRWVHKGSVLFNHFVELVVPFFYFAPQPLAQIAGILTVIFQLLIIASGNFSWLNHISLVIAIACFNDSPFSVAHTTAGLPAPVIYLLAVVILALSINPARNLFSKRQIMNTSFDPLHLVNTYGAFGSITRIRNEIILEGSHHLDGPWKAYEFKAKPGDPTRRPPWVAPYHYKLDWQMWFAAMTSYHYHAWIVTLTAKILEGNVEVLKLLRTNPFPEHPPKYLRAQLYEYHYTRPGEKNWWRRRFIEEYLPPLTLEEFS